MGGRGLSYIITDSWEAGVQDWTENMPAEFHKRRGYDMTPWLPALAGHIEGSSEASDRFLRDFRKTIGEMTAEYHYDLLTDLLAERGMKRNTESHESGRAFIGDGMEVKCGAAVPMSATWTPGGLDPGTEVATRYNADVRESASVAHLYGQNITKVVPDFSYTGEDINILYVHRKPDNCEIYRVNNRQNREVSTEASFRVKGLAPEIWDPVSGSIEEVSYLMEEGITWVPLKLDPDDARFIVFRRKTREMTREVPEPAESLLASVSGPWMLSFQPHRWAPEKILLDSLFPWNESTEKA